MFKPPDIPPAPNPWGCPCDGMVVELWREILVIAVIERSRMVKRTMLGILLSLAVVVPSGIMFIQNANAAPLSIPSIQQCDLEATQLCFNRDEGGDTQGTFIIGYTVDDPNNDFQLEVQTQECNGGFVSLTCPFNNDFYNAHFFDDAIVQITSTDTGWCAGTASSSTFTLRLEECPSSGTAGWNTFWIAPGFESGNPDWLVSVHSTEVYGKNNNWYDAQSTGLRGGIAIGTGTDPNCVTYKCWENVFH